jgi:hypothetical protein
MSLDERVQLRDYLLAYVCRPSLNAPAYVVGALCALFARLVKLGWMDMQQTPTGTSRRQVCAYARALGMHTV